MKKNIITAILVLLVAAVIGYAELSKKQVIPEDTGAPTLGKINIDAVCEAALTYMTFPDGKSADTFVAECKEGKQPQVIEEYKKRLDLGKGAAI